MVKIKNDLMLMFSDWFLFNKNMIWWSWGIMKNDRLLFIFVCIFYNLDIYYL